jgi:hypothetical protein
VGCIAALRLTTNVLPMDPMDGFMDPHGPYGEERARMRWEQQVAAGAGFRCPTCRAQVPPAMKFEVNRELGDLFAVRGAWGEHGEEAWGLDGRNGWTRSGSF